MSEQKRRPGRYPDEVRERAVRRVFDHQGEYPSQWKAIESISAKLPINHETLRGWDRVRAETDARQRPGLATDERARIKQLERENRELRRANDIFKAGRLSSVRSSTASPRCDRVHRCASRPVRGRADCRVITEHGCKIGPSTYWVVRKRPPSVRALRDAELVVEVHRVYAQNLFVYGTDKV